MCRSGRVVTDPRITSHIAASLPLHCILAHYLQQSTPDVGLGLVVLSIVVPQIQRTDVAQSITLVRPEHVVEAA